jgi:hypothetical protein
MYSSALWLHSLLRWAVLITGIIVWFRSIGGSTAKRPWSAKDELWSVIFVGTVDLQILVGLVLYAFLSPITKMGLQNIGAAMKIDTVRFFTVEHITGMIIGAALVHVGRVKIRKAADPIRKHRLAIIFFGLALVVMIISIPWPGMRVARPLFHP